MEEEESQKNHNPYSHFEDLAKNDDYLLSFSSQYKTNMYKEDEEEIKENQNDTENNKANKRTSADSTSISASQEYNNNISGLNQKKKSDFSKDDFSFNRNNFIFNPNEFYGRQRKMSSPLCDYLKGCDEYLSRANQPVDIDNSNNYVKKDDFFNPNKNIINTNININIHKNHKNNSEKNIINIPIYKNIEKNNSKRFSYNYNINNVNNVNNLQIMNNNNANNININYNNNNNYINNNNNLLFMNNNYPQQIFNINYINLNDFQNNPRMNNNNILSKRKMSYNIETGFIGNYFSNILNPNNQPLNVQQNQANLNPMFFSYNEDQNNLSGNNNNTKPNNKKSEKNKKQKKPFDKRKGDWKCPNCNNLNFAFRIVCNRCQIPKPNNISEEEN